MPSYGLSQVVRVGANDGIVDRLPTEPGVYRHPRFSPDGTQLAVERVDNGQSAIWIYDLSGETELRRLTLTGTGSNSRPVWTADSARIAFTSDRDGTESIWWQRADGTDSAQRLTEAQEGVAHHAESWSPDGVLSFVKVRAGDSAIWAYSPDEGASMEVYDLPGLGQFGSVFSPDGQWIAYTSAEGDGTGFRIFVKRFPDGPQQEVARNGAAYPVWAADGARLFYRPATSDLEPTLSRVDLVLQPTVRVRNTAATRISGFLAFAGDRDFDVDPDANDDVFVILLGDDANPDATSRINIVVNWNLELLERVPVETAWWQFWK